MHEVKNAHYLKEYILEIEFEDGKRKTVDFKNRLYGEVFEPLLNIERFKKFNIDKQLGTIVWETGADFCPDTLYAYM
jgi:hypothetical protein